MGARVRAAAVRPARRQRRVLRRARQHDVRHRRLRDRLRARAAAGRRRPGVGGRADPARAGPGAPARARRPARGGAGAAAARRRCCRARSSPSPSRWRWARRSRWPTRERRSCARSSPFLSPAPLVFLFFFLVVSPVSDLLSAGEASASADGPARSVDADRLRPVRRAAGVDADERTARSTPSGSPTSPASPRARRGTATRRRWPTARRRRSRRSSPASCPSRATCRPRRTTRAASSRCSARSHELAVVEPITDVCPARLCPEARPPVRARLSALADDLTIVAEHLLLPDDLRDGLPAIDRGWLGFGSEAERHVRRHRRHAARATSCSGKVIERLRADDAALGFARVEAALDRPSARPPLVFVHSSLPHGPARYLPDGRAYTIHRRSLPRVRARALDAPPVARRPGLPAARAADAVRRRPLRASVGQGASRRPLRRRGDPRHRRPRRVLPRGRAAPAGDGRRRGPTSRSCRSSSRRPASAPAASRTARCGRSTRCPRSPRPRACGCRGGRTGCRPASGRWTPARRSG